jgi:hypothetical protein
MYMCAAGQEDVGQAFSGPRGVETDVEPVDPTVALV